MIYNFEKYKNENEFLKEIEEEKFLDLLNENEELRCNTISMLSGLRNQMAEHCKLDNVVFLFGNGTSIYAGTKSTVKGNLEEIYKKDEYKSLSSIISVLTNKTIEEQLNVLLICQKYFTLSGEIEKIRALTSLISDIKKTLLNDYVNSIDYSNLIHHEILFRKLRNMNLINKVTLFTTNYDLAFEYSMDNISLEYSNGFTGFINRRFDLKTLQSTNKLKLYKIHGSVNWEYADGDIIEKQPKFSKGKLEDMNNHNDVLIFPTAKKMEETFNTPYSELMRGMLDVLEAKRNVVFVLGYRYRDEHINEILLKSISNPNNIYYFFDFDDDNSEFIKKIEKISEFTQNIFILKGKFIANFAVFSDYVFPSIASKTDEESIRDLLKKVLKENE